MTDAASSHRQRLWTALGARQAGRRLLKADVRGGQVFTLVADAARRNGELLVAPLSKPTHTTVRRRPPLALIVHH